ncbi:MULTISPECIES: hypothetical protein [unclassified Microcoleus]|uniref:hypothetical protein n=1 Tax=unclassified Microcoleus TaxID=2642155 RepID=UPI002FD29780
MKRKNKENDDTSSISIASDIQARIYARLDLYVQSATHTLRYELSESARKAGVRR